MEGLGLELPGTPRVKFVLFLAAEIPISFSFNYCEHTVVLVYVGMCKNKNTGSIETGKSIVIETGKSIVSI